MVQSVEDSRWIIKKKTFHCIDPRILTMMSKPKSNMSWLLHVETHSTRAVCLHLVQKTQRDLPWIHRRSASPSMLLGGGHSLNVCLLPFQLPELESLGCHGSKVKFPFWGLQKLVPMFQSLHSNPASKDGGCSHCQLAAPKWPIMLMKERVEKRSFEKREMAKRLLFPRVPLFSFFQCHFEFCCSPKLFYLMCLHIEKGDRIWNILL